MADAVSEIANIRASIGELSRFVYDSCKADAEWMPNWVPVDLAGQFPHLDHGFYDEVTRVLADAGGFRSFGDFEDASLAARHPDTRTPVRHFVSADGVVTAAAWHIRSTGTTRMKEVLLGNATNARGVSMSSEFADGTFVVTSTTKGRDRGIEIPGIIMQRLGHTAPVASVVKLHRRAVEAQSSKPVPVHTWEEGIESGRRLQRLRAAHLRAIGYVDIPTESKRWRDFATPDIAAMLEREIAHLQAHERGVERSGDGAE
jgi:hypothetical protein